MKHFLVPLIIFVTLCVSVSVFFSYKTSVDTQILALNDTLVSLQSVVDQKTLDYQTLSDSDQYQLNRTLQSEIKEIKSVYPKLEAAYQDLLDLRLQTAKISDLEKRLAEIMALIGKFNYGEAETKLISLSKDIQKKSDELAALPKIPSNVPQKDTAPTSGYSRQLVTVNDRQFLVDIIAADLTTTKVIVDTASDSDCADNCPVDSLGNFASRSGAIAGINGPYFCPESYPVCAAKKNSFDTLLMNKNKTYFNSSNNVYSSVPAAIFSTTSRFVEKSQDWGRDTGVDSVIAGQPLLVYGGQSRFAGDGDVKKTGLGSRSFIGASDNTVYIGLVRNASVADASLVLAKMGIKNALNLDSGGSTALWLNGKYLAGPGRNTPFGILLVKR